MGLPLTPTDSSAPSYDDLYPEHPVNGAPPSGSASAYARLPQHDDIELSAPHTHDSPSSPAPQQQEGLVQTLAGVFRPKPHTHCEACDLQTRHREERDQAKHCCAMVAVTFIMAFICAMVLGIVVVGAQARIKERHHG
ncbi:hypothetical protein EJ04DRAFT_440695 [Polyplosphaeria fusca]|uniref:Uncharacterized protein n=1 Tax=Polyplosphaeria fusca TaxID=682080 RepID=A0A9P4QRQ7_9PLEO|nr:hypothetical protein EJ04DRAFT_440695 [Polyplosphaeria fusca]